jgi:hypothetical protein
MGIVIGVIVVMVLVVIFSNLKKSNQELNDYYPFDPRKPKL